MAIIDAVANETPIFLRSAKASEGTLAGSLLLNNIQLNNVATAVGVVDGPDVLPGGTNINIKSWGQGNVYSGTNPTGKYIQGDIAAADKPSMLLDKAGRIFGKAHPQYAEYSVTQFVSAKDHGAKGDGVTDDTHALQAIFDEVCKSADYADAIVLTSFKYAGEKVIFLDAGTYIVTSTLTLPAGTRLVGEAWSVIAGKGSVFSDQSNPQVVVRAGEKYSSGVMEITDIIFSTVGPGKIDATLLDHLIDIRM